jgi:hypothetical protein
MTSKQFVSRVFDTMRPLLYIEVLVSASIKSSTPDAAIGMESSRLAESFQAVFIALCCCTVTLGGVSFQT